MSTSTVELGAGERMYAAVVAALGELSDVVASETADAGTYSYRYASLGSIMPKVRPVLAAHQLALSQLVTAHDGELTVATMLVHEGGQTFGSGHMTMRSPTTPQQIGSLISYLRRYQLLALLGLAVEDDDAGTAQRSSSAAGAHRGTSGELRITASQRGFVRALLDELGVDDEGDRRGWVETSAGRSVLTLNDLTAAEASKLIDELRAALARRDTSVDESGGES